MNEENFVFDKFMKDLDNKRSYKYLPQIEEIGLDEVRMKRLRAQRERELWQNRIQWRR